MIGNPASFAAARAFDMIPPEENAGRGLGFDQFPKRGRLKERRHR